MKSGFALIQLEKYVEMHLRSNPAVKREDLVRQLTRTMEAAKQGARCQCGAPIWILGSAEVGLGCFTCITGDAGPDHDYEIDLRPGSRSGRQERRRQQAAPAFRFRFEPGSYGSPERGFMPSVLCYEEIPPGQWKEHFCLVNPECCLKKEEEASAWAKADLEEAFTAKGRGGRDRLVAITLQGRGYMRVEDFRRAGSPASDEPIPF